MTGTPRLPLPYRPLVPAVELWIRHHQRLAEGRGSPLPAEHAIRLAPWFEPELLARVRVVVTDDLPRVPIPSLGIPPLREFLRGNFSGLTLQDTVFVRPRRMGDAGLFFHELVHVLQWQELGLRPFIHSYGRGLLQGGYARCPLEVMAYQLEARFREDAPPFSVASHVKVRLSQAA